MILSPNWWLQMQVSFFVRRETNKSKWETNNNKNKRIVQLIAQNEKQTIYIQ
jgi:hypothetical protein